MRRFFPIVASMITLLISMTLPKQSLAQLDINIGTGTVGNGTTTYPCPLQDFYEGQRAQYLYRASELTAAGMGPGIITSIKFNVVSVGTTGVVEGYQIRIGHTTSNTLLAGAAGWDAFSGASVATVATNYQPVTGVNTFTLPTPFNWNGSDNIMVEVCSGDPASTTATFWTENPVMPWTTGLTFNGSHTYRADDLNSLCGTATAAENGTATTRPNITFAWTPATACAGAPTAGTANASPIFACAGQTINLNLSGQTIASGVTYQWQSSSDNTNWNNITGATSAFYSTTQLATTYYRCVVTCSNSSQSANSTSVMVTTPGLVSGTFTINSAQPTGGTNFTSFNDAYNYIKCGINGPVTFNVDAASGPYTEQLIITPVFGASATNKVTFNGNGRQLKFTSTNPNERAVIKLNGADHFVFDSLQITATGSAATDYGFTVQLINDADSNTFRKCTIEANAVSTSTNFTPIVISSSATSATTTGSANCDGNTFSDNTVTGGYYSITNVGSSTVANQNNKFLRNKVRDFYIYGFYGNGTFNTLIEGNDISRPLRTATSTAAYAIYFTGLSTNARINANYIHGLYDATTTTTNDAYGIYFTGVDALAGLENRVTNNVIYDIKSNGTLYGIYNASSDNVFYYHNTISFDDASSAAVAAEVTRAFYQTTVAAGIEFKNNLVTLNRGGATVQTGIYMVSTATVIASNYNDISYTPSASISYGVWGTAAQATLANWQAASTQDANSVSIAPVYLNIALGNLKPTSPALNNLGTPVGVTTDVIGVSRSATTPDMGAWEFDVAGCTAPPTAGDATSSVTAPICPNEPVTLGLINNSYGTGQTYQWQTATSLAGPWTNLGASQNNPAYNMNPTTTLYYRCAVTCTGNTTNSTPVQVVVNALFPAGTYTINRLQPTAGTNFNSFNAAYAALRCGIAGPIVFNVVAGSGPYTEQVNMSYVQGTSAVNTVTFNGNGETITYLSTNTAQRAVFRLSGTDYFVFDSLVIVPQGSSATEYGYGFHLTNGADSNVIRRCTINVSTASTSTNFAGIVNSAGDTPTTTGLNESDGNVIQNNTITGGYYAITMVGSTTNAVGNNKIIGNTLKDFYLYGMYLYGNFNTQVESNRITRPTRATPTTFYGVYLTTLNTKVSINKNRIYNPFGGDPGSTSSFYGIYLTSSDALGGLENVISNNAMYDLNSSGTIYGVYNSSSDNIWCHHNTISLDDATTATTSSAYAFYQVTVAAGLEFKDNLISIARAGQGTKFGLYFSTTGTTYVSNNNNFYITTPQAHVGFDGANRTTLAAWQASSTQDANSVTINPYYTSPATGDLKPRSVALDNKGVSVGITSDIVNAARSATTPDIGAWEFTVPNCTTPPNAGAASATPNTGMCIGTPILLNLSGNSFGAGQSFQWQYATSAAGPWTNLGNPLLFADTTILSSGSFWYQCVVTCSGQSATSTPTQVTMNPPFPPGVYTINNTQPTNYPTGVNFNSFVEAVAVMNCGIGGPVTFNVAAGTYTEQVRIRRITGTSPTSRVTFQSANGNPTSVNLTYDATVAANNYVLKLDSAQYITFRGITVTAQNTTNGRAIDMAAIASYDSVVNCRVIAPANTGTATGVVGIFGSLVGTGNTIKGNTVIGGAQGIHFSGTSATLVTTNNVIDSNFVSNFNNNGVYVANSNFTSVNKNEVTLLDTRASTGYGVYANNLDSSYQVNGNKVMGGATTQITYGIYGTGCGSNGYTGSVSGNKVILKNTQAGTVYGIYLTTMQGNFTRNNVINVGSTGATSYGLYGTGGNGGIKYYNNTVVNSGAGTGTTNVAGYFSHSTTTAGVSNIRNNIFYNSGAGRAAYYVNVSGIYSDYNLFKSNGTTLINFGTTGYPTLQAWRNAQNWDYNSIVYTPAFAAGDELQPDPTNSDVWAMHGRGEQIADNDIDINGAARPTTLTSGVPDLGAYEFLPTVTPPVLPATPAAPAPGITQYYMFGTDTVQKITWGATVPTSVDIRRYSGVIPPGLATGQASMYYYTDVSVNGTTPTGFTNRQYYIDPWLRNIPQENTVKLGRTVPAGTWFVSSNSAVDDLMNVITESNLSYLGKFTGMTDGQAPPPAAPPSYTLDTSNRGRRFWVGYGHHYSFDFSNTQDMVLYLSAEDSANVTVKVNGTNWVRNYAIPANTVRVSDIMPENGLVDARLTDEGLYNRGISIESDKPIVAYAHILDGATSGAGLLLPTGAWGYEYTTLNSSQYYSSNSYSWFTVVSDRDSTLVEITPAVATKSGRPAGVPFQVYLNRGQVYQVMGTVSGSTGTDMSGSRVKSIPNASGKCFPIGVFSGSSRTAICYISNGDNFIQQVFPTQAWGTKYLTFGTANSTSNTLYNSNKWRVMVKDPTTVVRRNGTIINPATLVVPGNYYEFGVTGGSGTSTASYIESDKPVMVAQYMLSTSGGDCPGLAAPTGNGDPEVMYISPIEQGIKRAAFYSTNQSAITSNYINVVLPTAGLASLRIDGGSTFTDVFAHPGLPGYSSVRHNLGAAAGQHTIQCDSSFNAITYGLGSVESYGYNAGTLIKNLSALPTFNNVFNTGASSSYTCKGTPFRLTMQISLRPTQLVWQLSGISALSPNANLTQVNPTPIDSVIVNGRKFYIYTLPQQYVFNATGNFSIPIKVYHPSLEGCDGSVEVNLNINVIAAPVTDFTVTGSGCLGTPLQFNGTSVPSNNVAVNSWNWTFNDPPTNGTSVLQNPQYTFAAPGTYNVRLRAVAADGCIGDTTKPVTINPLPTVAITQDTLYVCIGASATFTIQNPVAGATYNWYNAATGGTLLGTGTTFVLNNVTALTSVWAEAVISGCTSATRDRAYANILPNLVTPVAVVDSVSTNTIVWRWNAVAGATSYQVSTSNGATWTTPSSGALGLTHTITGLPLGTSVTLQVRANGGCNPAVSAPVTGQTVTDQIYIPNSFTPNNDGLNDVLKVYSNVISSLRFSVYNQWGEKIFETTNQALAWDGSHKGQPQPSGVYIYVCDILLRNGERVQRKGSVNLVR
ncbi:MAG: gliding motility-associated C-terminal domain-containing protein [Bacteroidota bacterium]